MLQSNQISQLTVTLQAATNETRTIPEHWVLGTLLQLFQEYPNGITQAIALTELVVRWKQQQHKTHRSNAWNDTDVLCMAIQQFIAKKQVVVVNETLDPSMDGRSNVSTRDPTDDTIQDIHLFIHQRFHRYLPQTPTILHPFNPKRKLLVTGLRSLQRRQPREFVECLPTDTMLLILDPVNDPWDQSLLQSTACVSTLASLDQIPSDQWHIQLLRMKIVAVDPVRSCVSSINAIRRQTIIVEGSTNLSFLFVLWDHQTNLALALQPGDTLVIDCPYLNLRDGNNLEHRALFDESPGHVTQLFMEYGSSTILFVIPAARLTDVVTQRSVTFEAPIDEVSKFADLARYPLALDEWVDLPVNCFNAAFLGLVADMHVGHSSPLKHHVLTTYLSAASGTASQTGALASDTTVVLTLRSLKPPFPLLSIEITGRSQVEAILQCELGHLVFLQGVVLIKSGQTSMGVCSQWSDVYPVFCDARIMPCNRLMGYVQSPDFYEPVLLAQCRASQQWLVRASFVSASWHAGRSTAMVHRLCYRTCLWQDSKWVCDFCKRTWDSKTDDVEMAFGSLVVEVEDGSARVNAVVDSRYMPHFIGLSALEFDQLSLAEQERIVARKCTVQLYLAMLSSCSPRHISNIVWRIDQTTSLSDQVINQILKLQP
ncbi:unnamed protein product [Aphanomyces euteiches]|uniref:Uncharacterized protein n=1 Tax=Aphanomyces euteiches TaxID=100861 RepID=A0A6G0X1X8_9STRA|nr:hypothetical protein Ae201684_009445 [Aphanomyces euteiches]KAH9070246.1 hypothetical protein Ae201684P_002612 [Aphanomyces euteiches]